MCLKCPYPRWTTHKGSKSCNACRERHYYADFDRSKHQGLWGTGGQKERDKDVCAFDEDGMHPGACCNIFEGAKGTDERNLTINKIKIKEGYYRHTRFTAQTFVCRHPKACAGTMNSDSDDIEDVRLEGDELCRVGFTGNRIGASTRQAVWTV